MSAGNDTVANVTELLGYARVSTADQTPELQLDELRAAGCARIWTDQATGTRADRPELAKVLDHMRAGDTVVVWRLDRLARSLSDLIALAKRLEEHGVQLRSLREQIDTGTPGGRLIFHVFGALAEFEADLIRERTNAGLAAARARGRRGGRKPVMTAAKTAAARQMHDAREHTVDEIAAALSVSRASVYRALAKPAADAAPLQRTG